MRSNLLFLLAALTPAACGGSTSDEATDSGAADTSTNDASEAGGSCTAIANVAQPVTIQKVAATPPTAQGGTFVDGTYVLTSFTEYTGPGGAAGASGTIQITLQISGGTFEVVSDQAPTNRTVGVVASGSTLTATDTCPDATVFHESFTVTATGFVIYAGGDAADAGGPTLAETFTKQ